MLYLLDSQKEWAEGVVIAAYEIADERGILVATANSESEAKEKIKALLSKYPTHRFYVR